jgi:hypothetical protein
VCLCQGGDHIQDVVTNGERNVISHSFIWFIKNIYRYIEMCSINLDINHSYCSMKTVIMYV